MESLPTNGQGFLAVLQTIERVVIKICRFILGTVIACILASVVAVTLDPPWRAGDLGEWFYFTVGVLFLLAWTIRMYASLGRRQHRKLDIAFHSRVAQDVQELVRISGKIDDEVPTAPTDRGHLQLNVARDSEPPCGSQARDVLPDETMLRRIASELACGADMDSVCRAAQPSYADWKAAARRAYRQYVGTLLEQRSAADTE
jgi:hypothetical protein